MNIVPKFMEKWAKEEKRCAMYVHVAESLLNIFNNYSMSVG